MKAADFQQHLRITTSLGDSRVTQTALMLRAVHLFSAGHRFSDRNVKISEACLFILASFIGVTPGSLQYFLMYCLALENNLERKFLDDLVLLMSTPKHLEGLASLEITNDFSKGVFAVLTFHDGSEVVYGTVPEFKSSIVISGNWLKGLAFNLYRKEYNPFEKEHGQTLQEAFEEADPKIFEETNAINKTITQ